MRSEVSSLLGVIKMHGKVKIGAYYYDFSGDGNKLIKRTTKP